MCVCVCCRPIILDGVCVYLFVDSFVFVFGTYCVVCVRCGSCLFSRDTNAQKAVCVVLLCCDCHPKIPDDGVRVRVFIIYLLLFSRAVYVMSLVMSLYHQIRF